MPGRCARQIRAVRSTDFPASMSRSPVQQEPGFGPSKAGLGLTPELAEPIKRTLRGVYLLTYLKQEELNECDRETLFDRAAEDARIAQIKTLGTDSSSEDS